MMKIVLKFRFYLLLISFLFLNACNGNQTLQSRFAPNPQLKEKSQTKDSSANNSVNSTEKKLQLPDNFPADIPIYDKATLIKVENNKITWKSLDPLNLISNFYKENLKSKKWSISEEKENHLIATNPNTNQELKFTFIPSSQGTEFTLDYEIIPEKKVEISENSNNNKNSPQISSSNAYLQDLISLGIIKKDLKNFDSNKPITRREYARWLINTNNIFYANSPSLQIRLAAYSSESVFKDINNKDPDFPIIQGLAEAGLIPSTLKNDINAINFNPDKPLTREDLIAWKIPLDIRQALPSTSLDTIKETWGFQDATKIDPKIWSHLYLDWQNGDNSNIKRAFGYTTIFQPKKTVTYIEASTVLWLFGYQNETTSAQQVLENKE